jgi:hypothetical protein
VKMVIDLVYLTMCDSIVNMWIFVSVEWSSDAPEG